MPAMFSCSGMVATPVPAWLAGCGGTEASAPVACPAALPQFGQNAAPSAIWAPQDAQNAIVASLNLFNEKTNPRSHAATTLSVHATNDFPFGADNNRVATRRQ